MISGVPQIRVVDDELIWRPFRALVVFDLNPGAARKAACPWLPYVAPSALVRLALMCDECASYSGTTPGFARFDELEADRAAFYNTYRAGYNPYALDTVLKRMAGEEKEEVGEAEYHRDQFFVLLFGSHPPTAQRSMALSWESNFVKMPAKDSRFSSSAFDAMKRRIKDMGRQE